MKYLTLQQTDALRDMIYIRIIYLQTSFLISQFKIAPGRIPW